MFTSFTQPGFIANRKYQGPIGHELCSSILRLDARMDYTTSKTSYTSRVLHQIMKILVCLKCCTFETISVTSFRFSFGITPGSAWPGSGHCFKRSMHSSILFYLFIFLYLFCHFYLNLLSNSLTECQQLLWTEGGWIWAPNRVYYRWV